ncbi:hypothetical protein D187_000395 [Cystobacter fuscus DSM 2262]|uniref:VCBS repeat-containing protein n=1 Tax=Cystobacter fuscus (strain ATCC 25194 / DSM 2262 / NBRC 100088 / M29) TaxID=1242864 RepID=S9PL35_CYSF2|nr:hypothetical protein D187_000395 [Cystobacter fuscus DSM 2262]
MPDAGLTFEGTPVTAQTTCGRTAPFFATSQSTGAGRPRAVALSDLNRDGRLDLVFARSGQVAVLLGEGTGRFTAAVAYTVPFSPYAIAVADFNRDGSVDVVTTGSELNSASLLLGRGDGTFVLAETRPQGLSGYTLRAGDFNGDGIQDLMGPYASGLAVVLGKGDGTFAEPLLTSVSTTPPAFDVADVNGDGILDVAITLYSEGGFAVLLGKGDGTFPTRRTGGWTRHTDIRLADFNADSKLDVLLGNLNESRAMVYFGSGTGTFSSSQYLPTQTFVDAVNVADVNGDGRADAIALNERNGGADVYVFLAKTDGTFEEQLRYVTDDDYVQTAVGDINSDGMVDVVMSSRDANTFGALYGNRGGLLAPHRAYMARASPATSSMLSALAVADLNGDGRLDVAVADGLNGTVNRLHGLPDGGFSTPLATVVRDNPAALAVGDLDDNPLPDLVVANAGDDSITVLRQDATGAPLRQTYFVDEVPNGVALADLNGDGRLDVVTANRISGTVTVLLNDGTGGLGTIRHIPAASGANSVAPGDFNGDGRVDLAVANRGANSVIILRNDGSGGLTHVQRVFTLRQPLNVKAGDLNKDGFLDLAVAGTGGVQVLLGSASGFQAQAIQALGATAFELALADLNGDGRLDILAATRTSDFVSILAGRGDGTFERPTNHGVLDSPGSLAVADVDGDGALDLFTASFHGDVLQVSRNQGCR